jgi:hypothetical protein
VQRLLKFGFLVVVVNVNGRWAWGESVFHVVRVFSGVSLQTRPRGRSDTHVQASLRDVHTACPDARMVVTNAVNLSVDACERIKLAVIRGNDAQELGVRLGIPTKGFPIAVWTLKPSRRYTLCFAVEYGADRGFKSGPHPENWFATQVDPDGQPQEGPACGGRCHSELRYLPERVLHGNATYVLCCSRSDRW